MTARWRGLTGGRAASSALENRAIAQVVAGFGGITLGEWVLGTSVAIAAYGAGGAFTVALVGFRFVPGAIAGVLLSGLQGRVPRARILTFVAWSRAVCAALAAVALDSDAAFGVVIGLVSGTVEVTVDGERRRLLHPGDLFGEIAVLHRRPRIATVLAVEDTVVLTIAGDALRACLAGREDPVGSLAALS